MVSQTIVIPHSFAVRRDMLVASALLVPKVTSTTHPITFRWRFSIPLFRFSSRFALSIDFVPSITENTPITVLQHA